MKKLIPFALILLTISCRNEEKIRSGIDPSMVGKWQYVAYEVTLSSGAKKWMSVDSLTSYPSLIVRYDGVFLNEGGSERCCSPKGVLTINGVEYLPKPKEPIPNNPYCALSLCSGCQENNFQIDINGDEMIWSLCGGRSQYRRLP